MTEVRREEGATLVEVMVTLAIFGVVMLIVYQGLVTFQNSVSTVERRQENLAEARTIIAGISRKLRTASPPTAGTAAFLEAEDLEVTFLALVGSGPVPKKVRYRIDDRRRLVEETTLPDEPISSPPTFTTRPATLRVLGVFVGNSSPGRPLFAFYDSSAARVSTPVTGTGLLGIQSIEIDLVTTRTGSTRAAPTALTTRVHLRNVTPPTPTPAR